MKAILIFVLVLVVAALGSAGLFMLRRGGRGEEPDGRMARALAWRVGLSIALFLAIMLAWAMGWIEPKGIPAGR